MSDRKVCASDLSTRCDALEEVMNDEANARKGGVSLFVVTNIQTDVSTEAARPAHIPACCQCGALLLRVQLAPGLWVSICVSCQTTTRDVVFVPPKQSR